MEQRHAVLACSMVIISCLAAVGCGPADRQIEPPPSPVTIGTTDTLSDLDPAASYDFATWEIHYATMGGLLMVQPDGSIAPVLAASMPTSDERGLVWTVTLRQGLRFASGRELTADDVVWSVDRVRRLGREPMWFVSAFLREVKAVDSHTVEFHLLEPTSFFPSLLTVPTYFPLDPGCYPADRIDSDSTCGGIGRFRIKELIRGERIVLEQNPSWHGDAPASRTIVVRFLADGATLRAELENGGIDLAWRELSPADVTALRSTEGMKVWDGPSGFKRNLVLQTDIEPFGDPRVRQAVALLIDREILAHEVYHDTFTPLYSPIPNAVPGHIDTMPQADQARGMALLTEAGFTAEQPLSLELWWTTDHYGDQEGALAAAIKDQLEASGVVEVTLQSDEWTTFNFDAADCKYPAFLLGWYPDYLDLSTSVDFFALSSATSDLCSNYASDEMDRLIRAAQGETDAALRAELYQQIQRQWATEVPTIPLLQGVLTIVGHKNIHDVIIDPCAYLRYELLHK